MIFQNYMRVTLMIFFLDLRRWTLRFLSRERFQATCFQVFLWNIFREKGKTRNSKTVSSEFFEKFSEIFRNFLKEIIFRDLSALKESLKAEF